MTLYYTQTIIYMYIHLHIFIYVCTYTYVYMYTYRHIYVCLCVNAFCAAATCDNGQFRCDDGTCLMPEWLCDGQNDCPWNSSDDFVEEDEDGCGELLIGYLNMSFNM